MATTDLAAAVWALHAAIKERGGWPSELLEAERAISGAAKALFPLEHNRHAAQLWHDRHPERVAARTREYRRSGKQHAWEAAWEARHPTWRKDRRVDLQLKRLSDARYRREHREEILARRRILEATPAARAKARARSDRSRQAAELAKAVAL